jgi:hypothetical protein
MEYVFMGIILLGLWYSLRRRKQMYDIMSKADTSERFDESGRPVKKR